MDSYHLGSFCSLYKDLIRPIEMSIVGTESAEILVRLLYGEHKSSLTTTPALSHYPLLHHSLLPTSTSSCPKLLGCLSFRQPNHLTGLPRDEDIDKLHSFIAISGRRSPIARPGTYRCWSAAAMRPKDATYVCGGDDALLFDDAHGLVAVADGVGAWSSRPANHEWNRNGCPVGLFSLELLARLQHTFATLTTNRQRRRRRQRALRSPWQHLRVCRDMPQGILENENVSITSTSGSSDVKPRRWLRLKFSRSGFEAPCSVRKHQGINSLRGRLCEAAYKSANKAASFGGTTLLCVAISKSSPNESQRLEVVRVGDSDLALFRRMSNGSMAMIHRTDSSRRQFNCPAQITRLPPKESSRQIEQLLHLDILDSIDRFRMICDIESKGQRLGGVPWKSRRWRTAPSSPSYHKGLRCHKSRGTLIPGFEQFSIPIVRGDLLVVGTDGLFDNLFDEELVESVNDICSKKPWFCIDPKSIAEELCLRAYKKSIAWDKTPFTEAAALAGLGPHFVGGKPDDISTNTVQRLDTYPVDLMTATMLADAATGGRAFPLLGSVSGIVSLLSDGNPKVQESALKALLDRVDYNWHEISEAMVDMYVDDRSLKMAALLTAKLAYNLEMREETLQYAMAAEELFDLHEVSEFTLTVAAKAVEKYCQDRQRLFEMAAADEMLTDARAVALGPSATASVMVRDVVPIDPRLERLVERMMDDSQSRGSVGEQEALGVALEARRLDLVRRVIERCSDKGRLLRYCLERCDSLDSRRFRSFLHTLLVELYDSVFPVADLPKHYNGIMRALFLAGYHDRVAQLLHNFLFPDPTLGIADEEKSVCMAYQCAFDLVSYEDQPFLANLLKHPLLQLPEDIPPAPTAVEAPSGAGASASSAEASLPEDGDETAPLLSHMADASPPLQGQTATSPLKATDRRGGAANDDAIAERPEASTVGAPPTAEEGSRSDDKQEHAPAYNKISRLRKILSGQTTLDLAVEFLHRMNRTDLMLLDQIKASVDPRSSITQNAIVICHALMQAGTTCDVFLRENLDWLGRAVCWAKFTAAASTGLLHKGHIGVSRQVLSAYLPGSGGGSFSEGGALFGLGLIHANRFDADIKAYLLEQLQNAQTYCPQNYEPLQHGACLGLGLLAMGSNDAEICGALRGILFMDSAVSGEAAAIAMGLVSLETGSEDIVLELLGHAQDTEHERIVRGASLGAAFVLYRKEEEADGLLEQMMKHTEPMIRYSGAFAIGLAYCGTSNNSAVRRLLHIGVTDVSSDVRRAAVTALGFVMCNSPQQLPTIVALLADSFNPHVRYAAALAVGIGCSGTGSQAAVDLLLPMTQDTVDFVRQGALLGLGLVLVEASLTALPNGRVRSVRDLMVRVAADKHEDAITRFGSIIAQGLIDAGGRNSTIGFFSSTGALRPESAVGFALFSQLWFWHPLVLAGALAFRPTAIIGLTSDLVAPPDFEVRCHAPAGKFAYVEPVSKTKKEEKKETISAVLSTAQRRRQQEHIKKLTVEAAARSKSRLEGDVEPEAPPAPMAAPPTAALDGETPAPATQDKALSPRDESLSTEKPTVLKNLCRVVPGQETYMDLDVPTSPWVPIDTRRRSGIVMLKRKEQHVGQGTDVDMTGDKVEQEKKHVGDHDKQEPQHGASSSSLYE